MNEKIAPLILELLIPFHRLIAVATIQLQSCIVQRGVLMHMPTRELPGSNV